MTNLRAIQKNYYPPRFVRSAWYMLIRSSWSLIWRSSVFFSSGPEALRSSRPRASTCSQSIAADTARAAALKVGGKAGRLINTLWREIPREGLQPEPAEPAVGLQALVQACDELGVEHEGRTVTKPFST